MSQWLTSLLGVTSSVKGYSTESFISLAFAIESLGRSSIANLVLYLPPIVLPSEAKDMSRILPLLYYSSNICSLCKRVTCWPKMWSEEHCLFNEYYHVHLETSFHQQPQHHDSNLSITCSYQAKCATAWNNKTLWTHSGHHMFCPS